VRRRTAWGGGREIARALGGESGVAYAAWRPSARRRWARPRGNKRWSSVLALGRKEREDLTATPSSRPERPRRPTKTRGGSGPPPPPARSVHSPAFKQLQCARPSLAPHSSAAPSLPLPPAANEPTKAPRGWNHHRRHLQPGPARSPHGILPHTHTLGRASTATRARPPAGRRLRPGRRRRPWCCRRGTARTWSRPARGCRRRSCGSPTRSPGC